jgi:large subunit ribosomal protein L14e
MSLFRRFVQIGRVALIQNGPDKGKIGVIIEIVDQNRALLDGPEALTGLKRQIFNFKDISLTDIVVKVPRGVGHKALVKAFKKDDVLNSGC